MLVTLKNNLGNESYQLILAIAQVGRQFPLKPSLQDVEIFQHYFDSSGNLTGLDKRDGICSRRELLLRYLLVNAVLDQGPDTEGVRTLLTRVTNELYRQEVRFLHRPADFFKELGIAVEQITSVHEAIKKVRAVEWAKTNQSRSSRYNLFLDHTRQVLSYAIFRWGTPLAVPLLLTRDNQKEDLVHTALLHYLETWPSAEQMSQQLKDHPRYGLGKAIGDKATHLFAKWMIHSYALSTRTDLAWGPYSFEVPFDSNAGRVLWRTGFFLQWASLDEYAKWKVIYKGQGKGGLDYLRITNIRGKCSVWAQAECSLLQAYQDLCVNYLKTHHRAPKTVEIQRIPIAILLDNGQYTPGDLDDGLMYIGTRFCFNHDSPLCNQCPISNHCCGHQSDAKLIRGYRT